MTYPGEPWSDHEDDRMRRYAADGFSAGQTAKLLGTGRTRSSVTGRAHRLGVKFNSGDGGRSGVAWSPARRAAQAERAKSLRSRPAQKAICAARERAKTGGKPAPVSFPIQTFDPLQMRPFGERTRDQRAWVIDGEDGSAWQCCAPVARQSLCATHAAIALVPLTARNSGQSLDRLLRRYA